MLNIKAILFSLTTAVVCSAAEPLSPKKLQEIVESDHDNMPLVKALQIYPKAREYNVTITHQMPDGQKSEKKATASEKWVNGRFIVSEAQPAGLKTKFAMVVEYDDDEKLYRKYVIIGGKLSGYQVGTRIGETRSVSWIDLSQAKFTAKSDNLTTETHTDNKTTWQSIFFRNGKLQWTESGVATVTKR